MTEIVAAIHRYLGESLLTVAVIGVIIALFASDPKRAAAKTAHIAVRIFGVLVSIQWALGLITYFALPAATRPSLAHPIIMTLIVAGYHVTQRRLKGLDGPPRARISVLLAATAVLLWVGIRFV